jgi:putative ABC transport system substrate-binding protein
MHNSSASGRLSSFGLGQGAVRRRAFIKLLGGAAAAWPLGALGQDTAPIVVGLLSTMPDMAVERRIAALRDGLRHSGYPAAQAVTLDIRRYMEGSGIVADLATKRIAAIVTLGNVASRAAKAATDSIPIVFVIGGDPVQLELVSSLSRPGTNATGVSLLNTSLESKRLQLLAEVAPRVNPIGVLVNPHSSTTDLKIRELQEAAGNLQRELVVLNAARVAEIEAAFETIKQRRIDALLIASDNFFGSQDELLGALVARHRIPAVYAYRDFAVAGGLMTYGPSVNAADRTAGNYLGRILQGANPADLPVIQASKIDLVINLKTARALNLEIPTPILGLADEVIEGGCPCRICSRPVMHIPAMTFQKFLSPKFSCAVNRVVPVVKPAFRPC